MRFKKLTVAVVAATTALAATFTMTGPSAEAHGNQRPVTVAQRAALPRDLPRMTVELPDIPPGETFGDEEMLGWFECSGKNKSPAVKWRGAPEGTKSFLISLFDVDSKTSSGFWHWSAWNIPATTGSLPQGAGTPGDPGLPAPSVLGRTDFGTTGYGGACPPAGDRPHRYVFTVVALDVADIKVPQDLPMAAVNVVMQEHALAAGYRTVVFGR
ncbi:YbhB/YbcL family Raf kinase inhibitor-like protein [Streptomyces sp. Wb2n-11]|uniref:YbhB/YbcL family Raf kinase inhibitor-like protein n=1 Tax=Streptomyces sp. Wb2n-11 TaxID=1030533 RepID=UPI000A5820DE|nr:YbhB/YbcL family Raf kinase inhibitor-like protein [Streptomyces sp. Wb2n-11]